MNKLSSLVCDIVQNGLELTISGFGWKGILGVDFTIRDSTGKKGAHSISLLEIEMCPNYSVENVIEELIRELDYQKVVEERVENGLSETV